MELAKKDRMAIAKFLNTESGAVFMANVGDATPSVARSPNAHEMQFDSGRVQGWGECVKHIKTLATLKTYNDTIETDDTLRDE